MAAAPRLGSTKLPGMSRVAVCFLLAGTLGLAAASPSPALTASASALDITLLHMNDMHARYEETNKYSGRCSQQEHDKGLCYGGYARVATLIKEARAQEGVNTLVLNAGDNFQGSVYYTVFKWNISAHFTNLLGFDATTLGNHEFDDHVAGLVPYVKALKNPLVIANADFSKEPTLAALNISKSVVLERDGVKIGVVGYLTPETTSLSSTDNVTFSDEVTALTEETERLKKLGVNILIALGHSGYQMDQKIAAQVPEIDVVIGGHSHSFLHTGERPDLEVPVGLYPTWVTQETTGKKVPVVQAYAFTKYMGKLLLSFDANGDLLSCEGKPVLLNSSVAQDPETLAELQRWKKELSVRVQETVGQTAVLLDATKCRQQECNIGNLIADAAVAYRAEKNSSDDGWSDAPIALVNAGAIRTSIDASSNGGNITLQDVMEVLPFDSLDVVLKVRGSVLREALEHSVKSYVSGSAWSGAFLQMAGVHVTYNLSLPAGSRVVSAKVRCGNCSIPMYSSLDDSALYSIIVNGFLANGGDGYTMLATNEGSESLQETDASILEYYLTKHSTVYPAVEGRITLVGTTADNSTSSTTTESSVTASPSGGSRLAAPSAVIALLLMVLLGLTDTNN